MGVRGPKAEDLTGKIFGRWTVRRRIESQFSGRETAWECECECGEVRNLQRSSLIRLRSKSCGCYKKHCDFTRKIAPDSLPKRLYSVQYKSQAKRRGYSFELTYDECLILFTSSCYYCGIEPRQVARNSRLHHSFLYNGIDRLNNSVLTVRSYFEGVQKLW